MFIMMDDKEMYNKNLILKYHVNQVRNTTNKQLYNQYVFTFTDGTVATQTVRANSTVENHLIKTLSK